MPSKTLTFLSMLLVAGSAWACQVPVFRYAFEQWDPDRYRILVFAENVNDDLAAAIESLRRNSGVTRCADIELIRPDQLTDTRYAQLWKEHGSAGKPLALTLYPAKAAAIGGTVAHVSGATREDLSSVVDSPVRQEIAQRLSAGQSAVWLLLESGDEALDQAARQTLQQQLDLDALWLELPTPEEMEIKPEILEQVKVKLRVGFSVISVRRDDAREKFLINCLLNSEADLRNFDAPVAFPVFGRGLVLYALVGKGIAPDTIRAASSFICGPCSCQVKEQNPGFDLLLNHDWDAAVGETKISQPIAGAGATPKLIPIPAGRNKG
jgi:hypothetical protein